MSFRLSRLRPLLPWVLVLLLYGAGTSWLSQGEISIPAGLSRQRCYDVASEKSALFPVKCKGAVEAHFYAYDAHGFDDAQLLLTQVAWPHGNFGSVSGAGGLAYITRPFTLDIASSGSQTYSYGFATASVSSTITSPLQSDNARDYPLDTYRGDLLARGDAQDGSLLPLTLSFSEIPVADWNIVVTQIGDASGSINGRPTFSIAPARVHFEVARSSSDIFIVFALSLILVMFAIGAQQVVIAIARGRRPPSLSALGWLATGLFATLQVRQAMPDSPAIGVKLDYFVTFPVTAVLLLGVVVTTVTWIRRSDWDLRNQPDAD